MTTTARTMFGFALLLIAFGYIKWFDYRGFPLDAKAWLIPFVIIPGYAVLIMAWCGMLAQMIWDRIEEKDRPIHPC